MNQGTRAMNFQSRHRSLRTHHLNGALWLTLASFAQAAGARKPGGDPCSGGRSAAGAGLPELQMAAAELRPAGRGIRGCQRHPGGRTAGCGRRPHRRQRELRRPRAARRQGRRALPPAHGSRPAGHVPVQEGGGWARAIAGQRKRPRRTSPSTWPMARRCSGRVARTLAVLGGGQTTEWAALRARDDAVAVGPAGVAAVRDFRHHRRHHRSEGQVGRAIASSSASRAGQPRHPRLRPPARHREHALGQSVRTRRQPRPALDAGAGHAPRSGACPTRRPSAMAGCASVAAWRGCSTSSADRSRPWSRPASAMSPDLLQLSHRAPARDEPVRARDAGQRTHRPLRGGRLSRLRRIRGGGIGLSMERRDGVRWWRTRANALLYHGNLDIRDATSEAFDQPPFGYGTEAQLRQVHPATRPPAGGTPKVSGNLGGHAARQQP